MLAFTTALAGAFLGLAGCQARHHARSHRCDVPEFDRCSSNVLLGRRCDENLLALDYAGRSSWPWKPDGYLFDEYETSHEFQYDSQRFIDRDGGTFWRGTDSVRVRTRMR